MCVEEYQELVDDIVRDGRLYAAHRHQDVLKVSPFLYVFKNDFYIKYFILSIYSEVLGLYLWWKQLGHVEYMRGNCRYVGYVYMNYGTSFRDSILLLSRSYVIDGVCLSECQSLCEQDNSS